MALFPPTKLRPFSKEFSALIGNIITEVNRMSEISGDIQRARMLAPDPGVGPGGGGGGDTGSSLCIFITDTASDSGGGSGPGSPTKYSGYIEEYDSTSIVPGFPDSAPSPVTSAIAGFGWDFGTIVQNEPLQHPLPPGGLSADFLEPGTRVLAHRLTNTVCIFSSVMPRFSVTC